MVLWRGERGEDGEEDEEEDEEEDGEEDDEEAGVLSWESVEKRELYDGTVFLTSWGARGAEYDNTVGWLREV